VITHHQHGESFNHCLLQPNLNELPVEAGNNENKENISRKRSLSDSNSTPALTEMTRVDSEGQPMTKRTKIIDICLGSKETTDFIEVKPEPFVDGMHVM